MFYAHVGSLLMNSGLHLGLVCHSYDVRSTQMTHALSPAYLTFTQKELPCVRGIRSPMASALPMANKVTGRA